MAAVVEIELQRRYTDFVSLHEDSVGVDILVEDNLGRDRDTLVEDKGSSHGDILVGDKEN